MQFGIWYLLYHIWLVSYISTFLFTKPIKTPAFGLKTFTCLLTGNLVERRGFIDKKIQGSQKTSLIRELAYSALFIFEV